MTAPFQKFLEWAGKEGYDTAHTYDTDRSKWVVFNPMTADLWKAYKAGAAPLKADAERWRRWYKWICSVSRKPQGLHKECEQIEAERAKEQKP